MQKLAEPQPVREQATNLKISVNLISTRYICNPSFYPRHDIKTQDSDITKKLLRNEELWTLPNPAEPKFLFQQVPQKICIFIKA